MSATTLNKLSDILMYSLLLTAVFSILVMIGGRSLFKKANRKKSSALYPIVNLFIALEIGDASIFWGILFFVPILNVLIACLMFYKLGSAFNAGFFYKIGLVLLPIIFYPMLALGSKRYKLSDQEYFKLLDSAKGESVNLMTQSELNELNNVPIEDEEPKVDSIFKSDVEEKKAPEPYKAVRIDVLGLNKLEQFNKNKTKLEDENNKK